MIRIYIAFTGFVLLYLTGCASIGPPTVARDRFDYIEAISDSWRAQTLLNMVKLRYGDAPVFLDVASVITQTGVTGTVAVSGTWWQNLLQLPFTTTAGITAAGTYGEKPTVTYLPISGEKFARNLMAPIPPAAILNFLQGGYPVDLVLRLTVHSINGIRSRFGAGARAREAEPEFYSLIEKLRNIQQSGEIGLRVKKTATRRHPLSYLVRSKAQRLRRIAPRYASFSVSIHRLTNLVWLRVGGRQ